MKKTVLKRFLSLLAACAIVIISPPLSFFMDPIKKDNEVLFGIVILIGVIIFLLFEYRESFLPRAYENSNRKKLLDKKRQFLDNILDTIKLDVTDDLKKHLENGKIEALNDLVEEKIRSFNRLIDTIEGDETNALRGTDISSVSAFYESTNARIRTEIHRINSNSIINLGIGVLISVIAIGFLLLSMEKHQTQLMELIPRATVSILIEAFAFFFFTQYRKQQEEIKYWNNEKTTLDLKIFSLSLAIDDDEIGTKDFMRGLINDFIITERNVFGTTPPKDNKEDKSKINDNELLNEIASKIKSITDILPKK